MHYIIIVSVTTLSVHCQLPPVCVYVAETVPMVMKGQTCGTLESFQSAHTRHASVHRHISPVRMRGKELCTVYNSG